MDLKYLLLVFRNHWKLLLFSKESTTRWKNFQIFIYVLSSLKNKELRNIRLKRWLSLSKQFKEKSFGIQNPDTAQV